MLLEINRTTNYTNYLLESIGYFVFILLVVLLNNQIETYEVNGTSMEPNYSDNSTVIIVKSHYTINRFDVITFEASGHELLLKRVIGLPGEIITIANNKIYIDGEIIQENYIDSNIVKTRCFKSTNSDYCSYSIPKGYYFVLGDNRNGYAVPGLVSGVSVDSRTIGLVHQSQIDGKVIYNSK